MRIAIRAAVGAGILLLGSTAIAGVVPTPKFTGEGAFTLECRGTTTEHGVTTAATRTYAVDTKRCVVEPSPAAPCICVDETITCESASGEHHSLIINRTTTKVVEARPDWRFEGRCKRRTP